MTPRVLRTFKDFKHYLRAGIANRAIRPMLGIVDPLHTRHMPERVTVNTGFDVFW